MLLTLKVNHFSSFVFNMGIIIKIGFPGGSVVKNPPANARDLGLISGSGRAPGEGHGNPLQYSCPKNPYGERSLAGYSPRGHKESDVTEQLTHTQTILTIFLLKKRKKRNTK